MVLGINYEGGKGIERAAACKHCLGAYNCQIAMAAPFEAGGDAPEEKRAAGRSEIQMGATDSQLITQLLPVLRHALAAAASIDEIESAVAAAAVDPVTNGQMTKAAANHAGKLPPHADVIVQIARGRSAQPTWDNVVRPALEQCCADMSKCKMVNGYRATDFPHFEGAAPFVYINVGKNESRGSGRQDLQLFAHTRYRRCFIACGTYAGRRIHSDAESCRQRCSAQSPASVHPHKHPRWVPVCDT